MLLKSLLITYNIYVKHVFNNRGILLTYSGNHYCHFPNAEKNTRTRSKATYYGMREASPVAGCPAGVDTNKPKPRAEETEGTFCYHHGHKSNT